MAAIDIVILLLLVMFGVVGWKQGIIKEAVQLVGMIIILVIAFMFKGENMNTANNKRRKDSFYYL